MAGMNRDQLQAEHTVSGIRQREDKFDTNIHGPWMNRWDIVHHNRHTQALLREGGARVSWDSDKPGDKA